MNSIFNLKNTILLTAIILLSGISQASTISVSSVEYIETDSEFFNDDHMLIEFQIDGTREVIHSKINSSLMSNSSKIRTENNVEITASLNDSFAEYAIDDRNLTPIEKIEYKRELFDHQKSRENWVEKECLDVSGDGHPDTYYWETGIFLTDYGVSCLAQNISEPVYNVGYLQSPPDVIVESEWVIEVQGEESESLLLSNKGLNSGSQERVSENIQIEFLGMRDLGSQAPNPQNTLIAYSSQTGWKLINAEKYNDYRKYRSKIIPKKIKEYGSNPNTELKEAQWLKNNHEEYNIYYAAASSIYSDSAIYDSSYINGENFENGVIRYKEESMFEWFVSDFLIRINGDFVGLEKNFGKPEIVKVVHEPKIYGLSNDKIKVEVTNNGPGTAFFEPQIDSEASFELVGVSGGKTFLPNETKVLSATLMAEGFEDLNETNSFIVEDRESGNTDSIDFEAFYEPATECLPGSYQIIITDSGNEKIVKCGDDGVNLIEIDTCGDFEQAELSEEGYNCVKMADRTIIGSSSNCELSYVPNYLNDVLNKNNLISDKLCIINNFFENIIGFLKLYYNFIGVFTRLV